MPIRIINNNYVAPVMVHDADNKDLSGLSTAIKATKSGLAGILQNKLNEKTTDYRKQMLELEVEKAKQAETEVAVSKTLSSIETNAEITRLEEESRGNANSGSAYLDRIDKEIKKVQDENKDNSSFLNIFNNKAPQVRDKARLIATKSNIKSLTVQTANDLEETFAYNNSMVKLNPENFKDAVSNTFDVLNSRKITMSYEVRESKKKEEYIKNTTDAVLSFADNYGTDVAIDKLIKGDFDFEEVDTQGNVIRKYSLATIKDNKGDNYAHALIKQIRDQEFEANLNDSTYEELIKLKENWPVKYGEGKVFKDSKFGVYWDEKEKTNNYKKLEKEIENKKITAMDIDKQEKQDLINKAYNGDPVAMQTLRQLAESPNAPKYIKEGFEVASTKQPVLAKTSGEAIKEINTKIENLDKIDLNEPSIRDSSGNITSSGKTKLSEGINDIFISLQENNQKFKKLSIEDRTSFENTMDKIRTLMEDPDMRSAYFDGFAQYKDVQKSLDNLKVTVQGMGISGGITALAGNKADAPMNKLKNNYEEAERYYNTNIVNLVNTNATILTSKEGEYANWNKEKRMEAVRAKNAQFLNEYRRRLYPELINSDTNEPYKVGETFFYNNNRVTLLGYRDKNKLVPIFTIAK